MPVSISTEGAIVGILGGAAPATAAAGGSAFESAFVQASGLAAKSKNSGGLVPLSAPDIMRQTLLPDVVVAEGAPPAVSHRLESQIRESPEAALLIVQRNESVAFEPIEKGSKQAETPQHADNDAGVIPPFLLFAAPIAAQSILSPEKQPAQLAPQNLGTSALPGAARGVGLPASRGVGSDPDVGGDVSKIVSISPKDSNIPNVDAPANAVRPQPVAPNAQPVAILPFSPHVAFAVAPPLVSAPPATPPAELAVNQPPLAAQTPIDALLAAPAPPAREAPVNHGEAFIPVAREASQPVPVPAANVDVSSRVPAMPPGAPPPQAVVPPAQAHPPKPDTALTPPQTEPPAPADTQQGPYVAKSQPLPESVAVASPDAQPVNEVSPRSVQADAPPPRPLAEMQDPAPDEKLNPAALISGAEAPLPPSNNAPRLASFNTSPQPAMQHIAQALHQAPDGKLELILAPQELGHLKMTLTPADSGINVTILAERPETADLMRRHIDMLGQEFRELGYRDVRFDFGQGGQRQQSPQDAPTEGSLPAQTLRSTEDLALAPLRRDGLDIRL